MKKINILVIVGFIGSLLFCRPASAVTVTEHTVELFAKPGDTFERSMQLYDDSLQGVTLYVTVGNFTGDPNQQGSALLVTEPSQMKPDRSYVKPSVTSIELPKSGGLVPFKYTILVPKNASPGTHLLSLVFSTKPPPSLDTGASVTIGTNILTNIFLTVTGNTIDSIETSFQVGQYTSSDSDLSPAEQAKTFKPKQFFIKPPVDFLIDVKNTGNTFQKPDGNITIQNDLFNKSSESIKVNLENLGTLPDPNFSRIYSVDSFGKGLMLGKYRAKLTLIYGDPLREQTREVSFWIVPVVEIAVVLGSIILIFILTAIIRRINKNRNERLEQKKERQLRETLRDEIQRSIHNANVDEDLIPPAQPEEPDQSPLITPEPENEQSGKKPKKVK